MVEKKILIIKYKNEVSQTNIDFLISIGAEIKNIIKSINAIIAYVPIDKISDITSNSEVEYTEEDQKAYTL